MNIFDVIDKAGRIAQNQELAKFNALTAAEKEQYKLDQLANQAKFEELFKKAKLYQASSVT